MASSGECASEGPGKWTPVDVTRVAPPRASLSLLDLGPHPFPLTRVRFSTKGSELFACVHLVGVEAWTDAPGGCMRRSATYRVDDPFQCLMEPVGGRGDVVAIRSGGAAVGPSSLVFLPGSGNAALDERSNRSRIVAIGSTSDQLSFATAAEDGALSIWRASSPAPVVTLATGMSRVSAVAISGNGDHVALGTLDGDCDVYRVAGGTLETAIARPGNQILSLHFTRDGAGLFMGETKAVERFDVRSRTPTWSRGHAGGSPNAIAPSPDGVRVAAVYDDGTLWVGDARTGTDEISVRLPGGSDPLDVAFAGDGRTLAIGTGMRDNHLYLLRLPATER